MTHVFPHHDEAQNATNRCRATKLPPATPNLVANWRLDSECKLLAKTPFPTFVFTSSAVLRGGLQFTNAGCMLVLRNNGWPKVRGSPVKGTTASASATAATGSGAGVSRVNVSSSLHFCCLTLGSTACCAWRINRSGSPHVPRGKRNSG